MEQSPIADNQQATLHDLSWLGGIVDGEGCITITKQTGNKVAPLVTVVNTNERIIQKVSDVLSAIPVGFHVTDYAAVKVKGNRPLMRIRIQGYKRVYTLLKRLTPFLIGKADRAKWVLQLCESRFSKIGPVSYSDYERDLIQKIWDSCGFGTTWRQSSETTCKAAREFR